MPQVCSQPLKPNPFETYRDPATGLWVIVYPTASATASARCSIRLQTRKPVSQPVMTTPWSSQVG